MYKEIQLAVSNKFDVEVICFEFDNWSKKINEGLKQTLSNVKMITIPAGKIPFFPWLWSVFNETIFRIVGKFLPLPVSALSRAVSRRSTLLIRALNKTSKPHWVIGHNPGAMWPVLKAAEKFNCKAGFDMEDYHPGEGHNKYLQDLTRLLMNKLFAKMNYVSFAAPLIMKEVRKDINIAAGKFFIVLNYFSASDFSEAININDGRIKLVWFSQNINAGRGLELILPFVKKSPGKLELHLIGNLNPGFYENYLKDASNIIIHAPMEQKDLHWKLGQFDIGLALEPAKDKNNDLALSNKMLAYLQSGLFIVATNTTAQESFLMELPGHGLCFDYKTNNAEKVFEKIIDQIDTIRSRRNMRYKEFKNRNWETASLNLLTAWNK